MSACDTENPVWLIPLNRSTQFTKSGKSDRFYTKWFTSIKIIIACCELSRRIHWYIYILLIYMYIYGKSIKLLSLYADVCSRRETLFRPLFLASLNGSLLQFWHRWNTFQTDSNPGRNRSDACETYMTSGWKSISLSQVLVRCLLVNHWVIRWRLPCASLPRKLGQVLKLWCDLNWTVEGDNFDIILVVEEAFLKVPFSQWDHGSTASPPQLMNENVFLSSECFRQAFELNRLITNDNSFLLSLPPEYSSECDP